MAGKKKKMGKRKLLLFDTYPWLRAWWNYPANASMDPETLPAYSRSLAAWRCPVCGHTWTEAIVERRRKKTCPSCGARIRQREKEAEMRFFDVFPTAREQFDPVINRGIDPDSLTLTDRRTVKWWCAACGGIWRSSADDRVVLNTTGAYSLLPCGICAGCRGRVCFATAHPDAAAQFDEDKNGMYREEIRSKGLYWWRCAECGSLFWSSAAGVAKLCRASGNGAACLACRRAPEQGQSFGELYPEKLEEYSLRNTIDPMKIRPGSTRKALWQCTKNPAHTWEASFWDRSHGCNDQCPCCHLQETGRRLLRDCAPELEPFFDTDRNGAAFSDLTFDSGHKVAWRCGEGHQFRLRPARMKELAFSDGELRCPVCSGALRTRRGRGVPGAPPPDLRAELAEEWACVENALMGIRAGLMTERSTMKVFWKCKKCGDIYHMSPKSRLEYLAREQVACPSCKGIRRNRIHYF